MDETTNLLLPYILAAQAQKHVTHNEALRKLDALVQISIVDRDLATPPVSPVDGARYIVAASPTGAWSGHTSKIAAWQDGAWAFFAPRTGWLAWIEDEATPVAWNGTAWVAIGGGSVNPTPLVGVNATADATNRLAVQSRRRWPSDKDQQKRRRRYGLHPFPNRLFRPRGNGHHRQR